MLSAFRASPPLTRRCGKYNITQASVSVFPFLFSPTSHTVGGDDSFTIRTAYRCLHTRLCTCVFPCTEKSAYVCALTFIRVCVCVYMCIFFRVYTCDSVYTCICVYVCLRVILFFPRHHCVAPIFCPVGFCICVGCTRNVWPHGHVHDYL